jgi:hypothetical protein
MPRWWWGGHSRGRAPPMTWIRASVGDDVAGDGAVHHAGDLSPIGCGGAHNGSGLPPPCGSTSNRTYCNWPGQWEWNVWTTACVLETAQSALHVLFGLAVLQCTVSVLYSSGGGGSGGAQSSLASSPVGCGGAATPPELSGRAVYSAPAAMRIGLAAAAVCNWLGTIVVRGVAQAQVRRPLRRPFGRPL